MAKRKIKWTAKANAERKQILEYWINRNKSKTYSVKLNKLFKEAMKNVAETPTIGRTTNFEENVRLQKLFVIIFCFMNMMICKLKFLLFGTDIEMTLNLK